MADGAQNRGEVVSLLTAYGHRPNKQYGQNFLIDPDIARRIVEIADVGDRNVVEIGAGTGSMTRALAAEAHHVVSYEIDRDLIPLLTESLAGLRNVDIRFEDVTEVDLSSDLDSGPWTMVANLPFNVGTGIVLETLRRVPQIDRLVVMVQTEVAERLVATPGSKTYGIPSVVVGLHGTARIVLAVPRHVFEPRPRVDSSVVVIDRSPAPKSSERAIAIASAGFGQRRKMLRRSLAGMFDDPIAVLERAGIDPTLRPEQLAPTDYVAIAEVEEQGSG